LQEHVLSGSIGSTGKGDGQFEDPVAIGVNDSSMQSTAGYVYVGDGGNQRVEYFSPTGEYKGQFNGSGTLPGEGIAAGASSKHVADASGITDPGQISRLLSRLRRYELIQDTGVGPAKGKARAWTLAERGQGILQVTGQA
jgi:hypothetical protein